MSTTSARRGSQTPAQPNQSATQPGAPSELVAATLVTPTSHANKQGDQPQVDPPAQPTLRPGTELRWRADGDVLIGTRPGALLHGSTAHLIGVVRALSSVDGTRAWSHVVSDALPEPLLLDLVKAGCIIDDTGSSATITAVGVDAARARVIDGDADSPTELSLARRSHTLAIRAPEPIGSALAQACATAGIRTLASDASVQRTSFGVHVHLADGSEPRINPEACDAWLRANIPHMSISVAGTRIRASHVVVPGLTPCLYCHALGVDDADNTQLARRSALHGVHIPVRHRITLSPDTAAMCAGLVLGRTLAFLDGLTERVVNEVVLDTTGRCETSVPVMHPACGCSLV